MMKIRYDRRFVKILNQNDINKKDITIILLLVYDIYPRLLSGCRWTYDNTNWQIPFITTFIRGSWRKWVHPKQTVCVNKSSFTCETRWQHRCWTSAKLLAVIHQFSSFFFFKIFGGHKSFSWGTLFWTSSDVCVGFQSKGGSLFVLSHLCNPQIHLWCDTCWLYRGQHSSQAFLIHILQMCP